MLASLAPEVLSKHKPSFAWKSLQDLYGSSFGSEEGACNFVVELDLDLRIFLACLEGSLVQVDKFRFWFNGVFVLSLGVEACGIMVLSGASTVFAGCCWGG